MNSIANRRFDRRRSTALEVDNNSPSHTGLDSTMFLRARVFLLLVPLVTWLPVAIAGAVGSDDRTGLVDIGGGRKLYLECRGSGSPTVVFISGEAGAATSWTMADPAKPALTVFDEVAKFARVCAYDRPGTLVDMADGKTKPSRSDPVPQPTTTQDAVRDLHALLHAANDRGPYVLVGHSFGGLVARLYANTYPNEVAGMVLVDPASEAFQAALKRIKAYDTWKATRTGGRLSLTADQLAQYPELERLDYDQSFAQLRAVAPLRPMPLVLLSSDHSAQKALEPLIAAGKLPPGIPADFGTISDKAWKEGQDHDSKLVPNIMHITKTDSGHNIQLEQPKLVVDAIRRVVEAVRSGKRQPGS
jgi:pimeloyl-ACP methyl ester carboxylesterase